MFKWMVLSNNKYLLNESAPSPFFKKTSSWSVLNQTSCQGLFSAQTCCETLFRHGLLHGCVWKPSADSDWLTVLAAPWHRYTWKSPIRSSGDDVSVAPTVCLHTQRQLSQRTCVHPGPVYVMEHWALLPSYLFLWSGENETVVGARHVTT